MKGGGRVPTEKIRGVRSQPPERRGPARLLTVLITEPPWPTTRYRPMPRLSCLAIPEGRLRSSPPNAQTAHLEPPAA